MGNNATPNDSTFSGGGIHFDSTDQLALTNSTLSGNSTAGLNARGGGISTRFAAVTLTGSTILFHGPAASLAVLDFTGTNGDGDFGITGTFIRSGIFFVEVPSDQLATLDQTHCSNLDQVLREWR